VSLSKRFYISQFRYVTHRQEGHVWYYLSYGKKQARYWNILMTVQCLMGICRHGQKLWRTRECAFTHGCVFISLRGELICWLYFGITGSKQASKIFNNNLKYYTFYSKNSGGWNFKKYVPLVLLPWIFVQRQETAIVYSHPRKIWNWCGV
jgi:hypothetical protein